MNLPPPEGASYAAGRPRPGSASSPGSGSPAGGAPRPVTAPGRQLGDGGPLLVVDDLAVDYRLRRGRLAAVRGVSLSVAAGETVAVVGESGSGKSTTAHAVLGLLPEAARIGGGRITFDGRELTGLGERRRRALRGRDIALVPQDPGTALNPVWRVGRQVAEALTVHGLADRRSAPAAALRLLADAGVPDPERRAHQYPHELSGGLRQRVLIAIAIAARPRLIVADEPTSALDVIVQRQILDHFGELTRASGAGVLLITHDLGVAAERADRIVVMAHGEVVEEGPAETVVSAPTHPYTRQLIAAAPSFATSRRPVAVRDRTPAPDGAKRADTPVAARAVELVKDFRLPRTAEALRAVDGVSFDVPRGETYALVGESGSGKSTVARLLLRLAEPTAGRVHIGGADVTDLHGRALRPLRRRAQLVYQNPYESLNPRMTVARIVQDPLAAHGVGTRRERAARAAELVDLVALPAAVLGRRPAELSGGQRQRVAIARALALGPDLLVCDEPVSALDVSVQAQILDLLADLQQRLGLSYLFISHDLAVVRQIAHHVGVMLRGRLVESGPADEVLGCPSHPYTQALLAAVPGAPAGSARS
ncbi:dipeptide ABC transporter ATP-binding protein [Actinacidiphila paucisporea]|uniref:Peptide/nickel transport system ATP-binding protein n=1 Tax=Actinacidiphila paucisporea TaxID=310782 RepID=A0A1M7QEQ2_9ACTN|nr:ABC transporter ATP-binding protein [Actinacidiphila paucisporea]SHN29392.1 peptide/nickel transport system ATP-binding protein [Actinacidiphila paucisporea]